MAGRGVGCHPSVVSNIEIVYCRTFRSQPISRISASFDPSSVRFEHRKVYSNRSEADFVMPSGIITIYLKLR
jgi:hypothetical protein